MGFLDSLMKLFGGKTSAEMQKEWEDNMTIKDIEALEAQGIDGAPYRQKLADRMERAAATEKRLVESLDFAKLNEYLAVPRDAESSFIKDVAQLNSITGKKINELLEAKIVYAAFVQAHFELYKSTGFSDAPKGAVVVIATDEKHIHNEAWLTNVANEIHKLKTQTEVPSDNEKLIKTLKDDRSQFCFKIGESLAGDADAWCATKDIISQRNLPNSCIPPTKIVPFLLTSQPENNQFIQLRFIPEKYFTK